MNNLHGRGRSLFFLCLAAALLTACRGGGGTGPGQGTPISADPSQPIRLEARGPGGSERPSALGRLDRSLAARAIENYRINKKRGKGPYTLKGVDLNGDGITEALVLFGGKDWCRATGCSLAIFGAGARGYKAVFRTVRVKPPIIVTARESHGWRDLIVMSGGSGGAPLRRVVLRFSGLGYPRNAMLEPEIPPDQPVEGEIVIKAPAAAPRSQAGP